MHLDLYLYSLRKGRRPLLAVAPHPLVSVYLYGACWMTWYIYLYVCRWDGCTRIWRFHTRACMNQERLPNSEGACAPPSATGHGHRLVRSFRLSYFFSSLLYISIILLCFTFNNFIRFTTLDYWITWIITGLL